MTHSIVNIQPEDIEPVLKIADAQLGASYITKSDLVRFYELDQILLFKQDQVIAGFITWEKEFPKHTLPYIDFNEREKIFIKSIVTDSAFQKQGIGTQLVNTLIENHPDHHLALLGWKARGHCNIQKLCLTLGFRSTGEIIDIWKKECESGAFDCPAYNCKCSCTALVFEK